MRTDHAHVGGQRQPLSLIFPALLTILACTIPARAGVLMVTGTFTGAATLTPTGMPGIFTEDLTGNGVSNLGNFAIMAVSTANFSNPPLFSTTGGTIDLTFKEGTLGGTS